MMIAHRLVPYILLTLLCAAVYSGCFSHDFLRNWDDTMYVTRNPAIREITPENIGILSTTIYGGNIAPLQMISYLLDHALWGLDPAGFKGTNILIQALCGFMLYRILITVARFPAVPALLAASLFLIHPVQVESVAWISQRKTLLATLFFLLSYLLYARFADKGNRRTYILSLLAFTASLLSKSSGVGLPLLLLAHDHCEGVPIRISVKRLAPFITIAAATALLTVFIQSAPDSDGGVVAWHGGSFISNARLALSLPASYLGLLLWPAGLSAHYPEKIPGFFSFSLSAGVLIASSWLIACVILLKRRNRLSLPLLLIGVGFLPVMQIVPLLPTMNDRYWHLPMAGVAVLCAALLQKTRASRLTTPVACFLVILLSILSFTRTAAWSDSLTLWQSAMKVYPNDPRILLLLGDSWRAYGRNDLAGDFFERSIQAGQSCEALQKAAAIRITDRSFERARMHLGPMITDCGPDRRRDGLLLIAESYHAEGKSGEAATAYETYLKEAPNSFTGHNALGSIYISLGRYDDAQRHLLSAVSISPESAARRSAFSLSRLADIRKKSGRSADAEILSRTIRTLTGR